MSEMEQERKDLARLRKAKELDHEVREFVEWVLCEAANAEKRLIALRHTLHTLAAVHDITLDLDKWVIKEDP